MIDLILSKDFSPMNRMDKLLRKEKYPLINVPNKDGGLFKS